MKGSARQRLAAALRAPAVHFLAIGALLFAFSSRASVDREAISARAPIVITAARIAEISDDHFRAIGSPPTPAELAALIDRAAEEEMLYREALALGLDRSDGSVEFHVVEKVRFLFGEAAGDNAQAYRRGLELGLQLDDPVVRSALATKMRLLGKSASRRDEPVGAALEAELTAYLERHADEYTRAQAVVVTQVFLSATKRGADLDRDAMDLERRFAAEPTTAKAAVASGDPFPAGNVFAHATRVELAKLFGSELGDAAFRLEPGRWSAPIRSPYGLHLLRVEEHSPAHAPDLASVRTQVLAAYRAERHAAFVDDMITELRAAYEVRVEPETHAQR